MFFKLFLQHNVVENTDGQSYTLYISELSSALNICFPNQSKLSENEWNSFFSQFLCESINEVFPNKQKSKYLWNLRLISKTVVPPQASSLTSLIVARNFAQNMEKLNQLYQEEDMESVDELEDRETENTVDSPNIKVKSVPQTFRDNKQYFTEEKKKMSYLQLEKIRTSNSFKKPPFTYSERRYSENFLNTNIFPFLKDLFLDLDTFLTYLYNTTEGQKSVNMVYLTPLLNKISSLEKKIKEHEVFIQTFSLIKKEINSFIHFFFLANSSSKSSIDEFLFMWRNIVSKTCNKQTYRIIKKVIPTCSKTQKNKSKQLSHLQNSISITQKFENWENCKFLLKPQSIFIYPEKVKFIDGHDLFVFSEEIEKIVQNPNEVEIETVKPFYVFTIGSGVKTNHLFKELEQSGIFKACTSPNKASLILVGSISKITNGLKSAYYTKKTLFKKCYLKTFENIDLQNKALPPYSEQHLYLVHEEWKSTLDNERTTPNKRKIVEENVVEIQEIVEEPNVEFGELYELFPIICEQIKIFEKTNKFDITNRLERFILKIRIWADGFTCLTWPLIAHTFVIDYPGDLFHDKKPRTSTPFPFMVIKGTEEKCNTKKHLYLLGLLIGNLVSKEHNFGKATIIFQADGLLADFSKMWDLLGNTHGGNLRCFLCCSSFSKENLNNCINYSVYRSVEKKDSDINFKLFFKAENEEERKKIAKEMGITQPYLLQAIVSTFMKNKPNLGLDGAINELKDFFGSLDNLHGCKGSEIRILKQLIKLKMIDKTELNKNLKKYLKRDKLSDLDGKKITELYVQGETIIFPLLKCNEETKSCLKNIFNCITIISYLSNQPPEISKYQGITLWFFYVSFLLGEEALKLPKELKVISLYLHMLVVEFPKFFHQKKCLSKYSCQQHEALLAILKKYLKHCTDKNYFNAIKLALEKFHYRKSFQCLNKDFESYFLTESDKKEKYFISFRSSLPDKVNDITLLVPSKDSGNLHQKNLRLFCEDMIKKFPEQIQQKIENNQLVQVTFFIKNDLSSYLQERYKK